MRSRRRWDPVARFTVTVGAVNAAIGGVSGHWALLGMGLALVPLAWGLHRQKHRRQRRRAPPYRPLSLPTERY